MEQSFSQKILFIYIFKIIGIVTGFLSMLMVVPRITSNKEIFGIYTVCISLNIFFSYADLGFISAGQKYASEYFIKKDKTNEIKVVGFIISFLTLFLVISGLLLFGISIFPEILINSKDANNLSIASNLLLILSLSFPSIILQRLNSILFSIRIEDYIYQGVEIFFNLLKILSIQLFINDGSYNIVGYFLCIQCLSLASGIIGLIIGFVRYQYNFAEFVKHFRLSMEMYNLTKSLAFSSLLTTIAWILYYEIDPVIINKLYGISVVSKYAIGFTILSFIRTMYNTLFGPFLTKFNHYVGLGDNEGLDSFYKKVVLYTMPLCIIPPIVIILYIKEIILWWVGAMYFDSVLISRLFVVTSAIGSITIPMGFYILAKEKNYYMRINALVLPFVFYAFLLVLYLFSDYHSLAIAKAITIGVSILLTFYFMYRISGYGIIEYYLNALKKLILPIALVYASFLVLPTISNTVQKSVGSFFSIFWHVGIGILVPLFVYYITIPEIKLKLNSIMGRNA